MRFEYEGVVPADYTLKSQPDLRFLVPGIGVFVASYAVSQLWLVFLKWNAWSLVPLVGPLTQFFTERGSVTPISSGEFNLALIGTIGQALGAAAITVGLVKPLRWLEKTTIVPTPQGVSVLGSF